MLIAGVDFNHDHTSEMKNRAIIDEFLSGKDWQLSLRLKKDLSTTE